MFARKYGSAELVRDRGHRYSAVVGAEMIACEDGDEMMRGLLDQPNCLYAGSFLGHHNYVHGFNRFLPGSHPIAGSIGAGVVLVTKPR